MIIDQLHINLVENDHLWIILRFIKWVLACHYIASIWIGISIGTCVSIDMVSVDSEVLTVWIVLLSLGKSLCNILMVTPLVCYML